MTRVFCSLGVLAALACGGDEAGKGQRGVGNESGTPPPTAAAPPPVDGAERRGDEAPAPSDSPGTERALDVTARNCLDLVNAARFVEAIAPCTHAAQQMPTNEELRRALDQARTGAADSAASVLKSAQDAAADSARAQANAAAQGASRDGASAVDSATRDAAKAMDGATGDATSAMDRARGGLPAPRP